MKLTYRTHVENLGWRKWVEAGQLSGTVGKGLRIEAIEIKFDDLNGLDLNIAYKAHVENIGWQDVVTNGSTAGTTDEGLRLEALMISLFGADANKYSIWYRVHIQNIGWQQWCKDGGVAGTEGQALRAEGLQILILEKGKNLYRSEDPGAVMNTVYRSHVENIGWKAWFRNGQASGTVGQGLRLEAVEIKLTETQDYNLGIRYRSHVENLGWMDWVHDGQTSGTVGQSLRLEAIEIQLTGFDASKFKVMYRGHIENSGWTDWVENGARLGTTGLALRAEAISVIVIRDIDSINENISNEIVNKAPYIQVWAVDFPISEYLIHDIRSRELVTEMQLTEELNKVASLQFKINPKHKYYHDLMKMRTVIRVFAINTNKERELLFEGRILEDDRNFYNEKMVICEGELAFLLDTIQRPAVFESQPIEQWLTAILNNHNLNVTQDKHIYMGIVTKLDNTYDDLRKNDYINTFELMKTTLLDNIGGIITIEHIGGLRFLDFRESMGRVNTQVIRFARNLLNYQSNESANGLITALIPVGKTIDGIKVNIESVNDGSDYIYNEEAVNLYGWIFGYQEWNDIEDPQRLLERGIDHLNNLVNLKINLELTALDLSLVNVDIQKINVGDSVRCISNPHGIDEFFLVTKKVRNFQDPAKDKLILGDASAGVTQQMYDDKQYLLKKIAAINNDRKAWIEYGNYPFDLTGVNVVFQREHTMPPVVNVSILKNIDDVGGGTETAKDIVVTTDLVIQRNDEGLILYTGCSLKFTGTLSDPSNWYVSVQIIGTYV
ncbi:phage tail spike protein [Acetobacterium carbinolicum]|uniref:phage tail spike protein n=1 Tax=Acetobacterium carbinolicum TaxID=52690 RepID=UPI0039BF2A88